MSLRGASCSLTTTGTSSTPKPPISAVAAIRSTPLRTVKKPWTSSKPRPPTSFS